MNAKTTLVLLPGLLCDEAAWGGARAAFEGEADVIVGDYGVLNSIGAMADAMLGSIAAPRFALAGHSMGGRIALEIVRRAPERVARLCLLDTGVDARQPGAAGEAERAQRMALVALARARGMRVMGREWALDKVHRSRVDTPLFEALLDMIERKTPAIFEAQIAALLARPDARGVLAGIRCPTLIGCGRDDHWSPLARHEQMHAALPGSRLVVIEEAGHMAPMEQPQALTAALRAWLVQP
jgi:pimeloyl-ACP methyl ester carboxylesterase